MSIVKKLVWDKHPDDEEYYGGSQDNLVGMNEYSIYPHPCATGYFVLDVMGNRCNEDYSSVESAKAAAQADYEARILSALTTDPRAMVAVALERAALSVHIPDDVAEEDDTCAVVYWSRRSVRALIDTDHAAALEALVQERAGARISEAEARGYQRGQEDEREACARYCDDHMMEVPLNYKERILAGMFAEGPAFDHGGKHHGSGYAAAIRARGGGDA